jgi:hypothetical protein
MEGLSCAMVLALVHTRQAGSSALIHGKQTIIHFRFNIVVPTEYVNFFYPIWPGTSALALPVSLSRAFIIMYTCSKVYKAGKLPLNKLLRTFRTRCNTVSSLDNKRSKEVRGFRSFLNKYKNQKYRWESWVSHLLYATIAVSWHRCWLCGRLRKTFYRWTC